MRTLLAGVNAKYIHTSLAVRTIYKYVNSPELDMREFTINEKPYHVMSEIYKGHYDAVMFSCYIWNIEFVLDVCAMLRQVSPKTVIILGGPEVSFDSEAYMKKYPFIDAIIRGEGEETVKAWFSEGFSADGMTVRVEGKIVKNPDRGLIANIDTIPFPYDDTIEADKLIYYESSRGCPFNCSYCLSSTLHSLRFRSVELVKKELEFFISHKVKIVKFVDRTFNADKRRTKELLRFLIERTAQTTFHFEVAADLLDDELIDIIKNAPKGLFQLEIGVQSTNAKTISAINRKTDFDKISYAVKKIRETGNVHMHLDLIAGLPYEDINSFKNSFNEVFSLRPHMLQLGFLKLLRGTAIREEYKKAQYTQNPPYEILENEYISFDDILCLKGVEEMTEKFYNSGAFSSSVKYLLKNEPSAFDFFLKLWKFFSKKGYASIGVSREALYEILIAFEGGSAKFKNILKLDYIRYCKRRSPSWSYEKYDISKERFSMLDDEFINRELPEYFGKPLKDIIKHLHFEPFSYNVIGDMSEEKCILIFDSLYARIVKYKG